MDALTGAKDYKSVREFSQPWKNPKAPRSFPTFSSFPRQLTQLYLIQLVEVKCKPCLSAQALKA